jgi:hypothetical protein
MRLRKFDTFARIIQRAMKRYCAVRVYQRQREQGKHDAFACHCLSIFIDFKQRIFSTDERNEMHVHWIEIILVIIVIYINDLIYNV